MPIASETLVVIDRQHPDTGELELLVGQQQRGEWQNDFNFPGGKVEPGEAPTAGAVREVLEETGIRLAENQLCELGKLILFDQRPAELRFGTVAVFGASVPPSQVITPNAEEFDAFWIRPTDRNVLLNMPPDVKYWLPLAFAPERKPFVCFIKIDQTGGKYIETAIPLPGQDYQPVDTYRTNL